ncbi:MAG: TonB-dependent receptor, partial [Bacteroidota bacterium]
MKIKKIILLLIGLLLLQKAIGQNLSQTIRGSVRDIDSELPLIGASVVVLGTEPLLGVATDVEGRFRFEGIPIGRLSLQISYLGYEPKTISNILVNSGKEVVLEIGLEESIVKMEEVVVTVNKNKGEALNDMAMISARSISPEQTNRYAGGFNDPSRIMSNFAGITNTQDGSNDIIVRGNSPKYMQWRLEGIQISNPNHFADQSGVSGAVSTLNNNLLATSDFYTGAFSPEYGDVLSGVYDVKLRNGNNEKTEAVFGFGLLGTDLTLEGPFKKGYGGSYLINYRYSTASIIGELGLIDGVSGAVPKFQDAAFKVVLPTAKAGTFSLFGLSGLSSFDMEDVKPDIWQTPGDNFMRSNTQEDYEKGSYLINVGLNHTYSLNTNSFIKTTLAYSHEGIEDDIFEGKQIKIYDANNQFLSDSVVSRQLNYTNRLKRTAYRAAITYNNKINAKNKIQLGTKYALFDLDIEQSQLRGDASARFTLLDLNEKVSTIRNFITWKHRLNKNITLVAGLHNMNVLLNNKHTFEPRLAFNWQVNPTQTIRLGYGQHSQMESIHNYFAKVEQDDGRITEPNKDLGLLKAHHFVLAYEKRFGQNLMAKIEAYYQHLYNLPVENMDTSYYATINEGLDFQYVDLVNKGTGQNYGLEITIEKFFANNYYYLINASLYESKYKSLEGITRNTQYNGNYLVNILAGKEFTKLGRKSNQTLGLNTKLFFGGGRRIIPLLRDEAGHLAVDPNNGLFWDYSRAYEEKLEDIYTIVFSASYKWDKPKATHEL